MTGLYGTITWRQSAYWAGTIWFLLVSWAIWHGNRWFLLKQREHYDWFNHPVRKVTVLLFANVFYTAPLTVAMLLAWYRFAELQPDWYAVQTTALLCVICVVFITHVYETVYLIRQREGDLLTVERLERAKTQAELDALKSQVDPHFLFNSLNTLSWLAERDGRQASVMADDLAAMYRYILRHRSAALVPASDELEFTRAYASLLQARFGEAIDVDVTGDTSRCELLPISLQMLIENAAKHNEYSAASPLRIAVEFGKDAVTVSNAKRERRLHRAPTHTGLDNLRERCHAAMQRDLVVVDGAETFTVQLPLRRV